MPKNQTAADRPSVRVKPHSYQPNKAKLEERIALPRGTRPEDLAKAAVTPVNVIEE